VSTEHIFHTEESTIGLGLSCLLPLAQGNLSPTMEGRIAIPDNLMRLIQLCSERSEEHRIFLLKIMTHYAPSRRSSEEIDEALIDNLVQLVMELFERGLAIQITDNDIDPELSEELSNCFEGSGFEISMSAKRNFVRDYYTRLISWSKKQRGIILERSRRLFSEVGHFITTLQIPDKLDTVIASKQQFLEPVFSFSGGKSTKWFIAIAVSAAGLFNPIVSAAGLALTFMDP
jgi:hypothetical protein